MPLDASTQHVLGLDLHFEMPEWLYVARTGSACVEVGGSLESLKEEITHTWEPGGEDVAIWLSRVARVGGSSPPPQAKFQEKCRPALVFSQRPPYASE